MIGCAAGKILSNDVVIVGVSNSITSYSTTLTTLTLSPLEKYYVQAIRVIILTLLFINRSSFYFRLPLHSAFS